MNTPLQQATDFIEECAALRRLLQDSADHQFARATAFKAWSVDAILRHLHFWNEAATAAWLDRAVFLRLRAEIEAAGPHVDLRAVEDQRLEPAMRGRRLLAIWWTGCERLAAAYRDADPRARVPWMGPDMSVMSAVTARQMETWAHGQAIFDLLGQERVETDRLRNIAHLGVVTLNWSFVNRGLPAPAQRVQVSLAAPSGALWQWNPEIESDILRGSATEFCQVVTQTRNVADTSLEVRGDVARRWMAIAQCFAGRPEQPPQPGSRRGPRPHPRET